MTVYREELAIVLETDQAFDEGALEALSRFFRDLEKETVRLLGDAMRRGIGHDGEVRLAFEHRSGDEWEASV